MPPRPVLLKPVTANAIDDLLRTSRRLPARLAAWEASKAVGPAVKPGMLRLRELRNEVVGALGYPDYFSYQVSDYGMSSDEMLKLNDQLMRELRPLYRELHTWARYELAKRYRVPVPDQLPAHWLPNRWGQDWSSLVEAKGLDVNAALAPHSAEWVVQQAEKFYRSLGSLGLDRCAQRFVDLRSSAFICGQGFAKPCASEIVADEASTPGTEEA